MEDQRKAKKQNLEALRAMVAVSYEIKDVSNNTSQKVHENGEKIDRIYDQTKEINRVLDSADVTSKEMTSFWYRWGRRLKGVFSRSEGEGSKDKEQQHPKDTISGESRKEAGELSEGNAVSMNEQDQLLEQMLINLRIANKAGKTISSELDRQAPLLQEITKNVDQGTQKMQGINKRLKKQFF